MHTFGIHDIGIDEYLSDRAYVSSSGLKQILRSPQHLLRYLTKRDDTSPQLDLGTAIHCAILEPKRFSQEYFALPVQNINLFHEEDLKLMRGVSGNIKFISDRQKAIIEGILEQLQQKPEIMEWLCNGVAEQSLFWRDDASGIRCQIRPDLLMLPHLILEVKSTFDASLAVFQRTCLMQLYHVSAAMYPTGIRELTGLSPAYAFLVVSRSPPYTVDTFIPSPAMLEAGEELFRTALQKLKAERVLAAPYL